MKTQADTKSAADRKAAKIERHARYRASLQPMIDFYRAQLPAKPFNGGAIFRATATR